MKKKIDVPLGQTGTTELGVVIAPVEYSKDFLKHIEDETKSACDECVLLDTSDCQRYACCFEERKDKKSVYYIKVIQHCSPHTLMSEDTKRVINKVVKEAFKTKEYDI